MAPSLFKSPSAMFKKSDDDFDSIKSNGTTTTTSEIFKAILKPQNIPIPEPLKVYDIPQPIVLKPEIIVCENGLRRSILKLPEPELISHGGGAYGSNGTKQLPKPKFLVCGGASVESFDTHALKETTTLVFVRAKKELESKLADSILVGTPTCHDFLDFIATERLRSMPHKGSKWDKILKWAESYARSVDRYAKEVSGLMVHTWESARLVWGCCKMLLQTGQAQQYVLEKVFGVFYQLGQTLDFYLRSKELFTATAEIQSILTHTYSDLVRLTVDVGIYYKKKCTSGSSTLAGEFDVEFGHTVDSFFYRKECFTSEVWNCSLRLQETSETDISIHIIRRWLATQDRTLDLFLSDRMGTRTARFEYTCEWFETHLKDFQRSTSDVMWVTGQSGCGKTTLTGWILERLKRTQGLRSGSDVVSFSIDFNVKSQRSSLSVVKGLLLQLLERNVGDLSLFKLLSALYERSERSGVAEGLEAEMWKALDTALSQSSGRILILIDGLDHLNGGESAVLELSERLRKIASKYTGVKCLLFSRPLSKPVPASFRSFVIQGAVNEADIRRFVKISFSTWKEFKMLKVEERDSIIEKVTVSSAGTFVWAQFALEMLRVEKTVAGIISSLDALPKGLPGLVQKLCLRLDMKHADTRLIVSMLLAAERPLSVKELGCLLEIDATNCTRSARLSNVEEDIRTACGSLVTIRDGLVCFAHASVKEYLFELIVSNKFSLSVEEAHTELTIRSLAYLKLCLKDQECEPSFTCGWDDKDGLVKKHRFFEYAVRNYIFHFKKSTMYKVGGKHTVTAEFKKCFAGSSVLALIEGSWWETQTSASTAVDLHLIALEIRRLVLGEKCRAVIQCQLNVALTQKRLSRFTAASETYFATMTLIRAVLTESHVAVKTCVKEVITCTESISVTKRSETITTRLEVVYKYMCEHSESSIEKITYAKTLAELYITLKKTEEALTIYREVRKLSVEVYGETHEETIKLTTKLTTILETTSKHEESTTITRTVLEVCEKTMEVWEEKRITATVRMVELYESRKEIKKAEELLLKLRSGIVELCKTRYEEKLLEAKIKITLQYVRFLKRQSRGKEAEKILVELWGEYKGLLTKKDSTYGDSLLVQIRIIGEEMKKWKNPSVAESIFSTLWGFYKRTSRQTSSEATSIAVLLASVLRSREEVSSEETILNEIFKASITRTTIDITVIKTFVELSAFYERQERWSEAIDVCTKSLVRVWGSIIRFIESAQTGVCSLPRHYHHEAIGLAYRLAVCYHREGKIYEAESLYIYMLAACRASLRVQDETILTVAEYLVSFYQSVGKTDKAIQVYHELFEECRGVLGVKHSISIKITYRLAGFCKLHQPRNAERYYIDIITALGRGSEECGIDSIEAVLVLCKIYEHDKKYREAGTLYKKLWTTFCRHGKDCGLSTETVLEIYKNYVKILEKEVQGSVTVYEVSVQFRGACITHYGKYHILTIQATIELARVLERDEAGHKQAISIYEEVCKIVLEHTQLRISMQTTILEVRKRLAQLYSFNASSTSKAEVIYLDSWEECRIRHGCTHNESLSRLFELVMFFKKQNRAECTATATMTLQTTIIEIVTKEKDTMRLFVSAGAIAKLYIALGHKELAFDLLKEIRLQLTSVEVKTSKKFGFSLREGRNIDRRATVFVVAFEETLKGSSSTTLYTDIMSDLMTETTLFESWMRTLKYGGGFEASLSIGARLRLFLLDKHRHDECNKITDELWELFLGEVGGEKANKSGIVWELFLVCVQEMGIEEHDITVLDVGAKAVVTHADKGDFSGSLELANWIYRYVKARGGFVEQRNMAVGFNLSLCMAGRNTKRTCHDEELKKKMMDLSAMILAEVLKASESEHMSFSRMDLEMVNPIVSILGEQGNFKDMERILRDLWNARSQNNWVPDRIVSIGHRLCEVLFAHGNKTEALALCDDICYNLRRVWGAVDDSTLASFNLLSSLHTHAGNYTAAQKIHVDLLGQVLSEENEESLQVDHAREIIQEQVSLLKRAYQRGGKWGSSEIEADLEKTWCYMEEVFDPADKIWGGLEHWGTWTSKAGAVKVAEGPGFWKVPRNWGFLEREKGVKHSCHGGGRGLSNGVHQHHNNGIGAGLEEEDE